MMHSYTVDIDATRLDKFVSDKLDTPRNQIQDLIKTIGIDVNGKNVKKCGFALKCNDSLEVNIPQIQKEKSKKEVDFDVHIIYEDEDIMVIDKPSNLTVHRAVSEKNLTLVDWLESKNITLSNISGKDRNGIVHRLDKPTSGVMVVAKNNEAHLNLSLQLQNRTMGRYYLAIINPILKDDRIIDKPIGRSRNNRIKMTTDNPINPRDAKTHFVKLLSSKDSDYELITAKLHTGRTHQIRVHLQSIQRSVIGDATYSIGNKDKIQKNIYLQAYILYLTHPRNNKNMVFNSDLNKEMDIFLKENFNIGSVYEKIGTDNIISLFSGSD